MWFLRFRRIWPLKRICMHNYTHMWLMCIHSWGNWVCFLSFDSIAIVVLELWNDRRTLSKMVFKTGFLANILWIILYGCMKMYEWLIGVEYDVVIVWYTFLLIWIMRNCMKLLIYGDVVDLDVIMLIVGCWWWIYTCLMLIFDTLIVCIELCCWILMCNLIVVVFACMKGVLVSIMVVVNNHDVCWIIMVTMLVNYICICAYMLLVNFLTCYWWWFDGVSMY